MLTPEEEALRASMRSVAVDLSIESRSSTNDRQIKGRFQPLFRHRSGSDDKPQAQKPSPYTSRFSKMQRHREKPLIRNPIVNGETDTNVGLPEAPSERAFAAHSRKQLLINRHFVQKDNKEDVAQHWKHVRRSRSSEPSYGSHQSDQNLAQPNLKGIATFKAVEEERERRLQRAKDGGFVGFNEVQQWEKGSQSTMYASHFKDKPHGSSFHQDPGTLSSPRKDTRGWKKWSPQPSGAVSPSTPQTERGFDGQSRGFEQTLDSRAVTPNGRSTAWSNAHRDLDRVTETPQSYRTAHLQADWSSSYEEALRDDVPSLKPTYDGSVLQERQSYVREVVSPPAPPSSRPIRGPARQTQRKRNKFVGTLDSYEYEDDPAARLRERKQQRKKAKLDQQQGSPPTPIHLPEFISATNLAGVLRIRMEDFLRKTQDMGFDELSNDHVLDAETAGLIASEFNFEPVVESNEEQDLKPRPPPEDKSLLPARPPVVTIMGHVDHGKTTLLDYLRKSSVAASEHGGITQHIGAFSVRMPGGRLVTFLDTPGHAAFLSMRQRGANVTDIVILVVAADDSVKPQTIEAIKHAQAAHVPIIVAINKVDKEDANIDRTKQDLARYGVEIEDFGGDTQAVCVSGKTGYGMKELEDAAVALADILDMRAETDGAAEGWVLEATTKRAGRVATVLVRRGTLHPGDVIVAGTAWARVRSLRNEAGIMVSSAGPGTPVEIDGWREQPTAGDEMLQAPSEQKAKAVTDHRLEGSQREQMATDMAAVNESRRLEQEKRDQLAKAAQAAELTNQDPDVATSSPTNEPAKTEDEPEEKDKEVFFILRADVSGSLEAVTNAVSALGTPDIRPHILRSAVGPITEFDIDHAAVAKGHVIAFNTVVEGNIARMAEAKGVRILDQSIIYRLVDDVKAELAKRAPEVRTQRVLGEAEIAQVFDINVRGRVKIPVAGCKVRNGVLSRAGRVRVLRGKEVVYDGMLSRFFQTSSFDALAGRFACSRFDPLIDGEQVPSPRSNRSRKTSPRCARGANAGWALKTGRRL